MVARCFRVGFLIVAIGVLAACAETPQVSRPPVKLHLAEAADQAAVLDRVIAAYTADHDWVSASATSTTPQDAVTRVRNGQLDAAIMHSEPSNKDSVWISGLAHDPIAIIVHPTNPIGDVTLAQLSDLFQGRTFDWTPFGGTGEVIPVSREAEAYSRQIFEERVMQTRAVTRNAVLKPSARDVIDFVANTPGAIGYAPLSQIDKRVKAISIEGVAPSPDSAASGKYVLSSPLYVIAKGEPQGDLREFMAWLLGNPGQTLLSQAGLGRAR
ncbi:MAG TPA: substrate-binding domain-containing protein [Anaerolineae bacterium]|nr:substrate-binding domain-containing protein [Anaerolineae bacterium]